MTMITRTVHSLEAQQWNAFASAVMFWPLAWDATIQAVLLPIGTSCATPGLTLPPHGRTQQTP